MSSDLTLDEATYTVVVNHEEQYSIWPANRELPAGWRSAGQTGSKADCLAHIEEVWVDMRPLSLRQAMEAAARQPAPAPTPAPPSGPTLVERLTGGQHPVVISTRPEPTAARLGESIRRNYVLMRFTDTTGGTELGVTLDPEATDLGTADFEAGTGAVHLEGTLELDFVPVRCIADIDVGTLRGQGHLAPLSS